MANEVSFTYILGNGAFHPIAGKSAFVLAVIVNEFAQKLPHGWSEGLLYHWRSEHIAKKTKQVNLNTSASAPPVPPSHLKQKFDFDGVDGTRWPTSQT
jgi:hypothetical protein